MVCRVIKIVNFYKPTAVKHGEVTERQGYSHIYCVPVELYTPFLTNSELSLTDDEINMLYARKQCFLTTDVKIMSNLADPFQLIHVTSIFDSDHSTDINCDEKMTALWNVDRPLNKAGQRLEEVVCRLAHSNELTEIKLFEELNFGIYTRDAFISTCSNFKINIPDEIVRLSKGPLLHWICSEVVTRYNSHKIPPDVDAGTGVDSPYGAHYGKHNIIARFTSSAQQYTYAEIVELMGQSREELDLEVKEALDQVDAARATTATATAAVAVTDAAYTTTFTDTITVHHDDAISTITVGDENILPAVETKENHKLL
jgi:hypothetical protein